MEMQQLRTFVTVARHGSITRAAAALCLSQPAVSAHIKTMEETLGLALFKRTPRGMLLTHDGARLLAKAEQTLGTHHAFMEEAARMKEGLSGRLLLGSIRHPGGSVLGRFLPAFAACHPEVEVTVRHSSSAEVLRDILDGSLDAGFYNEAGLPPAALWTMPVARFTVYLAAPPGLVEPGACPDWQALAAIPWICPTASTCCGKIAEDLFLTHKFQPKRIINVDQEQVTRSLIAGGVGVGLLHADSAREAQAMGEVTLLYEMPRPVSLLFAFLAGRSRDALLQTAGAVLRDFYGDTAGHPCPIDNDAPFLRSCSF
jgi:DNA-binding transcriptional LysR family regulator